VADHHHHHHHDHGSSKENADVAQAGLDAAGASLAQALRLSFRILTFIIVLLCGIFLFKGVFSVESDQKALVLRFGAANPDLVMDAGLHFAFPYPIDEVVMILVRSKKLEVNTFWRSVSKLEIAEAIDKNLEVPKVIEGAEHAYLITGDLNVLQARWDITYRVPTDDQSVLNYFNKIGTAENEERLIRCLVQSAAVSAMGKVKVFDVYPKGQEALTEEVSRVLRNTLDSMECGIQVDKVNLIDVRPPEAVRPAFDQLIEAQQEANQIKKEAERDAKRILIEAAGEKGPELGEVMKAWWVAKDEGRTEDMAKLEEEMTVLYANASGRVRNILAEARAYRTTVAESAKGDASQITSLLANSPENIKIFLDHSRIEAIEEVLDNAFEKFLYRPVIGEDGKTRPTLDILLNRRPEILREQTKVQDTF
jgi:regulator of protease activity HflC (stomatin/prohibitin superfamily)